MNGGIVVFAVLAIIAVGIWVYTITPSGKKWIKSL